MAWPGGVLGALLEVYGSGMGGGTGGGAVGLLTCGEGESESLDGAGCGLVSDDSAGGGPSGMTGLLAGVTVGSGGCAGGCKSSPSG